MAPLTRHGRSSGRVLGKGVPVAAMYADPAPTDCRLYCPLCSHFQGELLQLQLQAYELKEAGDKSATEAERLRPSEAKCEALEGKVRACIEHVCACVLA